ncbi:hypothetical protein ACWCQS_21620, partial [Streptomyces sp. NPDC002076]
MALCVALVVPAGLGVPAAHAAGGGLGKPVLPKQRVDKVQKHPGLGARKARAQVARTKAANVAQAQRAHAQQHAVWSCPAGWCSHGSCFGSGCGVICGSGSVGLVVK